MRIEANNSKQRVLILAESYLNRDPRVQVQIEALKHEYNLTCCGIVPPDVDGVEFIPLGSHYTNRWTRVAHLGFNRLWLLALMKAGRYEQRYFQRAELVKTQPRLHDRTFDLIICNDVDLLPFASVLKDRMRIPLYLDAHEYTPRQWDGDARFQSKIGYWEALLRKYAGAVDYFTTVCKSIAEEYESEFGLKCDVLVYNVPFYNEELTPSNTDSSHVRMVHHGGLNRNRSPEVMIELMDRLDERFELDFMLIDNNPSYLRRFKRLANSNPRIRFIEPVPTRDIPVAINEYDIGLFLLDPSSFNYRNALPNKFFEFVQARLATAIWPSHEMKRIVESHSLGVVAESFNVESAALVLNDLTAGQIMEFKRNAHSSASEFCAEGSIESIRAGVRSLLGQG